MWRQGRWLRIADGPDEVHKMVIALRELNRYKPARAGGGLDLSTIAATAPADFGPDRRAEGLRRGHPRLRRAREVRRLRRTTTTPTRLAGEDGRAGLVGAQDPRRVRRLGRQLPRRPLFLEETARGQIPIARLRRDADRGRRPQPLRHRGAEARPARGGEQGRRAGDRDVRARLGLGRGLAEDQGPAARTGSGCSPARRCGAATPTGPATR